MVRVVAWSFACSMSLGWMALFRPRHAIAFTLAALGLVLAGAGAAAILRREAPRVLRLAAGVAIAGLAATWLVFLALDLGASRFVAVLALVPMGAAVGARAPFPALAVSLAGVVLVVGAALVGVPAGLPTMLLVLGGGAFTVAGIDEGAPETVLGALVGLAHVWAIAVLRADNGCTGVSGSYAATLLATMLLLFPTVPLVAAEEP